MKILLIGQVVLTVKKNRDHKTTYLKDIPRRKLQETQQNKAEKSEDLDQLEVGTRNFQLPVLVSTFYILTSKH